MTRTIRSLLVVLPIVSGTGFAAEPLSAVVGPKRGICLLVEEKSAQRIAELAGSTELTIVVQLERLDDVRRLQSELDRQRLLGTRVYVSQIENGRLCLADNMANAVVAAAPGNTAAREELLRVLQPRGRLVEQGRASTVVVNKPVADGSGEWTHPYQDASNNPLAADRLARAPFLTKFLAAPHYGPMPEVTLSAGGRLFKAFGHLAFKRREWPMVGKLVAIDAYNGAHLWQRDMEPGFMIHRNTMVATADTLYLADHVSCKLIDAATGDVKDEITVPDGLADGPVWKWMTIKDGVLYALVGEEETLHTVHRGTRGERGWPWTTVKATYGDAQPTWGFGRTLFAMDLNSRDVLWSKQEEHSIDSRATAMAGDRIFYYSKDRFVAAIDTANGEDVWRTSDEKILDDIGEDDPADNPRLGYATSSYMKSTDDAIYFAGPQRRKLVAISAKDGYPLWSYDDGNMQLIIRDDGLYAMGRMQTSKKFDLLSGEILADLKCFRGNCTRATGTVDSIFTRGYRHTGTMRFDLTDSQPHRMPSMRPACQDGVLAANGQLYWGPWMCDCNHSLVGVISLAPAGSFDFNAKATNKNNLRRDRNNSDANRSVSKRGRAGEAAATDWPTYRADNRRSSSTSVAIPNKVDVVWHYQPKKSITSTPAIAVGNAVFFSGTDGIVRSLDADTGDVHWSFATDGRVYYPPSYHNGRVFVGSADGWLYALDASTGESIWRFRAAPIDRRIPVYGRLSSTWPVATGVLVDNGVAYAAAGIAGHDGTFVYALDVETGQLVWQNTESDNLIGGDEVTGVSVQGHLLLHSDRLYMAGGNVVSPAVYDVRTGECLNELSGASPESLDTHWQMQRSSRGSELFLKDGAVLTGGRMLYSQKQDGISSRYNSNYALLATGDDVVIRGNGQLIERVDPDKTDEQQAVVWRRNWFTTTDAIVVASNAIVIAGQMPDVAQDRRVVPAILALNPDDGSVLWSHRLPERVVNWGVSVNQDGRLLVSLRNGDVVCLAVVEP